MMNSGFRLYTQLEPLRGLGGGDASVCYENWEKCLL